MMKIPERIRKVKIGTPHSDNELKGKYPSHSSSLIFCKTHQKQVDNSKCSKCRNPIEKRMKQNLVKASPSTRQLELKRESMPRITMDSPNTPNPPTQNTKEGKGVTIRAALGGEVGVT